MKIAVQHSILSSLLLFLLTVITGCESMVNDLDEDKLLKVPARIVAECFLSPQSPYIDVMVGESQPLFGSSTSFPRILTDAKVLLTGESSEIEIPFVDSLNAYRIAGSQFRIEPGKSYRMTISHQNRMVTATCTVPSGEPVIKSYSVDSVGSNMPGARVTAHIRTSWDDFEGVVNYYNVRGFVVIEDTRLLYDLATNRYSPYRIIDKLQLDHAYLNKQISDKNLDGITFESPTYKINLPPSVELMYPDENGNMQTVETDPVLKQIHFEILNTDENYFRYHRSLSESHNNDNPFVEPTLIYTNIEGGLGCFGAFNLGKLTIYP